MSSTIELNISVVKKIYDDVFKNVYRRNIDVFLCGAAGDRGNLSTRDKMKQSLSKYDFITVLYPEDLFMELLNKKTYDLLTLENFLANNCDLICIVCESAGAFVELGAFVNNAATFEKVIALVQTKYKNKKSFIMMGPIRYIQSKHKSNVIYYSTDLTSATDELKRQLYRELRKSLTAPHIKDINLISGQYYFILLLLFFYKSAEVKSLISGIREIYNHNKFEAERFDIVYSSAIRRLFKEHLIEKKTLDNGVSSYSLSLKGYGVSKSLIGDTRLRARTSALDSIRLGILQNLYY
ncbi:hypothetical protein SDC9_66750 [bioreactor metagenome]|uniref:Uncharacterized protein n=1 Tax=bioreactor metagenome TaxID=1076179 RepID=A0A644XXC6_9ZZZZ